LTERSRTHYLERKGRKEKPEEEKGRQKAEGIPENTTDYRKYYGLQKLLSNPVN